MSRNHSQLEFTVRKSASPSPPNHRSTEFPVGMIHVPKLNREEQIVAQFLQNTKLGQVPYFTGWDTQPNSTLELVSQLEERRESREQEIFAQVNQILGHLRLERCLEKISDPDEDSQKEVLRAIGFGHYVDNGSPFSKNQLTSPIVQKKLSQFNRSCSNINLKTGKTGNGKNDSDAIDSLSTGRRAKSLSPNGPLITLKNLKDIYYYDNVNETQKNIPQTPKNSDSDSSSSPLITTNPFKLSKKRLGVRVEEEDGEYNDFADSIAILTSESPKSTQIMKELEKFEQEKLEKWENTMQEKLQSMTMTITNSPQAEVPPDSSTMLTEQIKNKWNHRRKERDHFIAELQKLQIIEDEKFQKEFDEARREQEIEKEKLELIAQEKEKIARQFAEEEAAAAAKLKSEVEALAAAKAQAQAHAAAAAAADQAAKQAQAQQSKSVPQGQDLTSSFDSRIPQSFQNCILYPDLIKFVTTKDFLAEINEKFKDIKKTNIKFYGWATKVISTPINQTSMDFQPKLQHFIDLFEGKPVQVPGAGGSFLTHKGQILEPELYLMNLFSYKFIKKAEAEATENEIKRENFDFLAKIGIELIRKFPILGKFIQAHFYKVCPFLVPFSYPRKEHANILEYAECIGQDLSTVAKGKDSIEATLTGILLNNLSGYCGLYCYMVKNMENGLRTNELTEEERFFSIGEPWRILRKLVKLEPQMEVTATVIHSLLESIGFQLELAYRKQYWKLVKYIKLHYLARIRQITPDGKGASLARLEMLLDSKYKHL